jgi:hypothetical protein
MAQGDPINRFTDADEEPTEILMPIEGYEKQKLVSLREAVAQIELPIYNFVTMVKAAERDSKNPSDVLTCDESASVRLYTMKLFEGHDSFDTLFSDKDQ